MEPLEIAAALLAGCVLQAVAFGLGFLVGRRRPGRTSTIRWVQTQRDPRLVGLRAESGEVMVDLLPGPRVLGLVKEVP